MTTLEQEAFSGILCFSGGGGGGRNAAELQSPSVPISLPKRDFLLNFKDQIGSLASFRHFVAPRFGIS